MSMVCDATCILSLWIGPRYNPVDDGSPGRGKILSLVLQRVPRGSSGGLMCIQALVQAWTAEKFQFVPRLVRTRMESFLHTLADLVLVI